MDPVDAPPVLRDRPDDYLVALAGAAGAEAIITGDRDLLERAGLEPPELSAGQACERFGVTDGGAETGKGSLPRLQELSITCAA
jgi:hypothetical protein